MKKSSCVVPVILDSDRESLFGWPKKLTAIRVTSHKLSQWKSSRWRTLRVLVRIINCNHIGCFKDIRNIVRKNDKRYLIFSHCIFLASIKWVVISVMNWLNVKYPVNLQSQYSLYFHCELTITFLYIYSTVSYRSYHYNCIFDRIIHCQATTTVFVFNYRLMV